MRSSLGPVDLADDDSHGVASHVNRALRFDLGEHRTQPADDGGFREVPEQDFVGGHTDGPSTLASIAPRTFFPHSVLTVEKLSSTVARTSLPWT
jgi:hypothetical protein